MVEEEISLTEMLPRRTAEKGLLLVMPMISLICMRVLYISYILQLYLHLSALLSLANALIATTPAAGASQCRRRLNVRVAFESDPTRTTAYRVI